MTERNPHGPSWSGQNWYWTPTYSRPSITVYDAPSETKEQFADRREREKDGVRKVPFGFCLPVDEPEESK